MTYNYPEIVAQRKVLDARVRENHKALAILQAAIDATQSDLAHTTLRNAWRYLAAHDTLCSAWRYLANEPRN